MLVSVIVPIYNVERYLAQCLDSIIGQTYPHLEIILVDDGSTDGSTVIAQQYAEQDGRIQLISQQNQGLSGARNTGVSKSTGEFLVFVDSDDWLHIRIIEQAVQQIKPGIDLVAWGYDRVFQLQSSAGSSWFSGDIEFDKRKVREHLFARMVGPMGEELSNLMSVDNFSMAWSKLYRREILISNKLSFAPTQVYGSEDVLFNIHFLFYCTGVTYLKQSGYFYRKDNSSSLTKNHGNTLYTRLMALYQEVERFLNEHGLFNEEFNCRLDHRKAISFVNVSLSVCSKRNSQSTVEKYREVKRLVGEYGDVMRRFSLDNLKVHWWLFFQLIKWRWSLAVFLYLQVIRKFVNR